MRHSTARIVRRILQTALLLGAAAALAACAASDSSASAPGEYSNPAGNQGTGVGQSGSQDFGRFRGLIEKGELPSPESLDSVGYFNEHKFKLPSPDCGEKVCVHGMFGVQGNMINGSNCTTVAIGFNTKLNPNDFDRPPLNMAIAVDVSGSMQGRPLQSVISGLEKMVPKLEPKDRITLVAYSSAAKVVVRSTPENDPERRQLETAIGELRAQGSTNIYAGLKRAIETVEEKANDDRQNRVILLSDGKATAGIQSTDRIVNLGRAHAEEGIGLTTIGVGREFDLDLMRKLSENGAGNFYFLEDAAAVEEVFVDEVTTFLVPLAEKVNIHFDGAEAYSFRAAYGTRNWTGDDKSATIQIPALFMASRTSVEDVGPEGGRRGGGGIILLELVPTTDAKVLADTPPGSKVGDITMTYRDPGSDETVEQTVSVENPLKPNAAPEVGEFSTDTVEKAFVALNIFAGFRMATDRASRGAAGAALDILEPLRDNVDDWVAAKPDEDIEADLEIMNQLIGIIESRAQRAESRVGQRPNPWPRD